MLSLRLTLLPCRPALQILFLTGVALTIGPQAALRFFSRCAPLHDRLVTLPAAVEALWCRSSQLLPSMLLLCLQPDPTT